MKKPTGYVFYKGPSMIDGHPIVGILITFSRNSKTGNLFQTYILSDNGKPPLDNALSGKDYSVCGNCPHRHINNKTCYVNLSKGVANVYRKYIRGGYEYSLSQSAKVCEHKGIRLGTYGDPAAIPVQVWDILLDKCKYHLGYTHQWKNPQFKSMMCYCMASCDNPVEQNVANQKGYRTFRIRKLNDTLLAGEFVCPASEESGKRLHCNECKSCNGGLNSHKGNPVIIVHGRSKNRYNPDYIAAPVKQTWRDKIINYISLYHENIAARCLAP